ncbi:MAG: hypothetical protein ACYC1C_00630 [Chloroflexota bacterium]
MPGSTVTPQVAGAPIRAASAVESRVSASLIAQPPVAQALEHIRERRWAEAQRILEALLRADKSPEAKQYLLEVRSIRRCLRQLRKWPRDADLHLQLGWLYFGLELGSEAAAAFERAVELDPELASAYHGLALEYLFEGKVAAARRASAQACALSDELPTFGELERTLERSGW